MIPPSASQISHHHKVTNITMSPTSLSPILGDATVDFIAELSAELMAELMAELVAGSMAEVTTVSTLLVSNTDSPCQLCMVVLKCMVIFYLQHISLSLNS